jgi:DNA modification methylase
MNKLDIRTFKIADLNPAKYNPRKKLKPGDPEYEKLKKSIEHFGYVELIIVNVANNNTVVSGHQRLSVLKDLGVEEVECVVVSLNDEQEKQLNLAMNKVNGAWDENALSALLQDMQAHNYNMELTGFDQVEMEKLFNKVGDNNGHEDNFNVEEELKKPCFSKTGDIWHLGKHTIICGDSTDLETYKKLLGDTKVNLVCTDAPYFVARQSSSGMVTNDDLNDRDAYDFLMKAFHGMYESMADDASIYEFYATSKARIFHDAFEDSGFKVGAGLVWKKDRLVLTRTDWKYIHEPIIWGWKKKGKHIWYGDQKQTTVFEFARIKSSKKEGYDHPDAKPVPLIAYLIQQCTQTNSLVLDPFMGSGTTLIACAQLGRIAYGIELEPKFVDVEVMRFKKSLEDEGQSAEIYLIRDGQKLTLEEAIAAMPQEENE